MVVVGYTQAVWAVCCWCLAIAAGACYSVIIIVVLLVAGIVDAAVLMCKLIKDLGAVCKLSMSLMLDGVLQVWLGVVDAIKPMHW